MARPSPDQKFHLQRPPGTSDELASSQVPERRADLGNGGIAAGVGVENIRDLRQQRNPGE